MTSETKVPMPDYEQLFLPDDTFSMEALKYYGDQRASERDAFWIAKVAWLAINFDRVSMRFFEGERFFYVEGIPGSFNTLGEVLERATLTNRADGHADYLALVHEAGGRRPLSHRAATSESRMMTTYSFGICGIRWLTSPRDDATPVLQFARSPVNGGTVEWFDVPMEVASIVRAAAAIGNKLEKSDE